MRSPHALACLSRCVADLMNNPAPRGGVSNTQTPKPFVASHGESIPKRLSMLKRSRPRDALLPKLLSGELEATLLATQIECQI